ncbi:MAG: hypothetical protein IPP71_11650 [Bacteroidetes bacterium]|nr:hypothetical protein [Bacteroidota bacterium]
MISSSKVAFYDANNTNLFLKNRDKESTSLQTKQLINSYFVNEAGTK